MGYSREELPKLIESWKRNKTTFSEACLGLLPCDAGTEGVNHMSFSDLPLLETADDEQQYHNCGAQTWRSSVAITRAFFDKALLGRKDNHSRLASTTDREVQVEWFGPVRKNDPTY